MLLAVLCATLAWGVYALWPTSALLCLEGEEVVGFDEARKLFYSTTNLDSKSQWIKTYDLTTGLFLNSVELNCNPVDVGRWPLNHWPLVLTADGRFIIPMSAMRGVAPAVKLPTLENVSDRMLIRMPPRAYGLSSDGKQLLLQDLEVMVDDNESLMIWDVERNELLDRIVLKHKPVGLDWGSSNTHPSRSLHMSHDKRYVAYHLIDRTFVVFDRLARQVVLRIENDYSLPRFINNGNTLALIPDTSYRDYKPIRWYQLKSGSWNMERELPLQLPKGDKVSEIGDQYLVSEKYTDDEPEWYGKLPDIVKEWTSKFIRHRRLKMHLWDLSTGEMVDTITHSLPDPDSPGVNWGGFNFGNHATCSNTGQFFACACSEDRTLFVWARFPARPMLCWLMVSTSLLLGTRVAWPRRTVDPRAAHR